MAAVARCESRRHLERDGFLKQWRRRASRWFGNLGRRRWIFFFRNFKGRLYTMGLRGDREFIIAFDIANGKEVWATPHGKAFRNDRGDGPRGTPTLDGDRLYALGGNGDLSSLDLKTGKIVWTMNVLSKFGGSNIQWGIASHRW
jgi:outer membrane protein assembly factor BamB